MITTNDVEQQGGGAKYMIGRLGSLMWTIWKAFWIFQFKALREVYWLMNSDAKVRSQGLQTVGRVNETETREHRDAEGDIYETHHVTYQFMADGDGHTGEQKVCNIDRIKSGDPIKVFYMPDRFPVRSAIEPNPTPAKETVERDILSQRREPDLRIIVSGEPIPLYKGGVENVSADLSYGPDSGDGLDRTRDLQLPSRSGR